MKQKMSIITNTNTQGTINQSTHVNIKCLVYGV